MKSSVNQTTGDYYYNKTENKICNESTHHYHSGFEVYYMKDGECHYFINNTHYEVVSGDIILIPEGVIHRTNYGSKPCTRQLLNLPSDFLSEKIIKEVKSIGNFYRNKYIIKRINEIFDKIEIEYAMGDDISKAALKCYTEELFILMLRNKCEVNIIPDQNSIVEKAIEYIQVNYCNVIKLTDVAKKLSVSTEHLSRIFKKETSFGFNEYVTTLRLQKAEYMLKNEPGRSISDIAYACGFNDSNYFSFKFKKAYGISPIKIRNEKDK